MTTLRAGKRLIGPLLPAMAALAAMTAPAQEDDAAIAPMTDERIERAIETELAFSDVVMLDRVEVRAEDGNVTLSGNVSSLAAVHQAEQVAGVIDGVRAVANEITIDSTMLPADEARRAVESALRRNTATDAYEVEVEAPGEGAVVLTGTVDSLAEKTLAERIAATVSGIQSIDNRIEVDTSRYYRAPEEIDADITERLRWDVRVESSQIDILVREGGRVTLSGQVGSLAARQRAIELAQIEGVYSVDATHLEVMAAEAPQASPR